MSVLDNAKKHFSDKASGELQKITVPEWSTDIYFKTINSFAVESKIIELTQQNKLTEALIETLILKAKTVDGKPMFTRLDKIAMMNEVDPAVITRVVSEMNTTATVDFEAVEKN
jgi:hypothetical protein